MNIVQWNYSVLPQESDHKRKSLIAINHIDKNVHILFDLLNSKAYREVASNDTGFPDLNPNDIM